MANSCQQARRDLLQCLVETDCIKNGGRAEDCLKLDDAEDGCMSKRIAYMTCKRGQLDMRTRFKGNMASQSKPAEEPK